MTKEEISNYQLKNYHKRCETDPLFREKLRTQALARYHKKRQQMIEDENYIPKKVGRPRTKLV